MSNFEEGQKLSPERVDMGTQEIEYKLAPNHFLSTCDGLHCAARSDGSLDINFWTTALIPGFERTVEVDGVKRLQSEDRLTKTVTSSVRVGPEVARQMHEILAQHLEILDPKNASETD